jgi:hypothetical protein
VHFYMILPATLLLSAQQVAHARQLLAQGERPVHVAHLLNVSRRTLERAVSRGGA